MKLKDIVYAAMAKDFSTANNIFGSELVSRIETMLEERKMSLVHENFMLDAMAKDPLTAVGIIGTTAYGIGKAGISAYGNYAKSKAHQAYGNIVPTLKKHAKDRKARDNDYVQVYFSQTEGRWVPKYEAKIVVAFMTDRKIHGGTRMNIGRQFNSLQGYFTALFGQDQNNSILGYYSANDPNNKDFREFINQENKYGNQTQQRNSSTRTSAVDISGIGSRYIQPQDDDADDAYQSPFDESYSIKEWPDVYSSNVTYDREWYDTNKENQAALVGDVKDGGSAAITGVKGLKDLDLNKMKGDLDRLYKEKGSGWEESAKGIRDIAQRRVDKGLPNYQEVIDHYDTLEDVHQTEVQAKQTKAKEDYGKELAGWDKELGEITQRINSLQDQNMKQREISKLSQELDNLETELQEFTPEEVAQRVSNLQFARDSLEDKKSAYQLAIYNDPTSSPEEKQAAYTNLQANPEYTKQVSKIKQDQQSADDFEKNLDTAHRVNMSLLKIKRVIGERNPNIYLNFPTKEDRSAQVYLDKESALFFSMYLDRSTTKQVEFRNKFKNGMVKLAAWMASIVRKEPWSSRIKTKVERDWPEKGIKSFEQWRDSLEQNNHKVLYNTSGELIAVR